MSEEKSNSADAIEHRQKRLSFRSRLNFAENELQVALKDETGAVEFGVAYGKIPPTPRMVFKRNAWVRNVGILWCVLGAAQLALAVAGQRGLDGSAFWLLLGLGCIGFWRLTSMDFAVFDTPEGSIFVLRDRQSDAIVSAIHERRVAQLLQWFKNTDYSANPQAEIEAIEWLVRQRALSRVEADRMSSQASSRAKLLSAAPPAAGGGQSLH